MRIHNFPIVTPFNGEREEVDETQDEQERWIFIYMYLYIYTYIHIYMKFERKAYPEIREKDAFQQRERRGREQTSERRPKERCIHEYI